MAVWIVVAIVALVLFLIWVLLRGGPPVVGTMPGGGAPISVIDRWVTAPTVVTVGVPTTFVFESQNNNPLSTGAQLQPIGGRVIGFSAGPPGAVRIVSIDTTSINATQGAGTTAAVNGQITVVIQAVSLPQPEPGAEVSRGALIGIPAADTSVRKITAFEIRAP